MIIVRGPALLFPKVHERTSLCPLCFPARNSFHWTAIPPLRSEEGLSDFEPEDVVGQQTDHQRRWTVGTDPHSSEDILQLVDKRDQAGVIHVDPAASCQFLPRSKEPVAKRTSSPQEQRPW